VRSPDPPPTFGRQNAVFWLLYGDGYCGMDILLVLCKSVDRFYTLTSQNPRPTCVGLGYRVQPLERRRPFNTERDRLHLEWGQVRVVTWVAVARICLVSSWAVHAGSSGTAHAAHMVCSSSTAVCALCVGGVCVTPFLSSE
jgi:hypothetical protein